MGQQRPREAKSVPQGYPDSEWQSQVKMWILDSDCQGSNLGGTTYKLQGPGQRLDLSGPWSCSVRIPWL